MILRVKKSDSGYFVGKHSLPETNISPENRPGPKRKVVFQPSIFRGHVSFGECKSVFYNLWIFLLHSLHQADL